jgi:hypothetical protein
LATGAADKLFVLAIKGNPFASCNTGLLLAKFLEHSFRCERTRRQTGLPVSARLVMSVVCPIFMGDVDSVSIFMDVSNSSNGPAFKFVMSVNSMS